MSAFHRSAQGPRVILIVNDGSDTNGDGDDAADQQSGPEIPHGCNSLKIE
jgi:hypothetical protein